MLPDSPPARLTSCGVRWQRGSAPHCAWCRQPILILSTTAPEGALFLEQLAPAIEQVDSSSGSVDSAVNRAIEAPVPLIAKSEVSCAVGKKWLDRLWEFLQEDDMSHLEYLRELYTTLEIASKWTDHLVLTLTTMRAQPAVRR